MLQITVHNLIRKSLENPHSFYLKILTAKKQQFLMKLQLSGSKYVAETSTKLTVGNNNSFSCQYFSDDIFGPKKHSKVFCGNFIITKCRSILSACNAVLAHSNCCSTQLSIKLKTIRNKAVVDSRLRPQSCIPLNYLQRSAP